MEKFYASIGKTAVSSVFTSLVMVVVRIIVLAMVWIGAKVVQWVFGPYLAHGLNILFSTTRFTSAEIPVILVVLSLFGTYIATSVSVDK